MEQSSKTDNIKMIKHKNHLKILNREDERVSFEPIGIGVQVLETEKPAFNNTIDNRHLSFSQPSPFQDHSTPRCNDFYDSTLSFYANNFSPDFQSSVKRHAPLVKSISSGYHGPPRNTDPYIDDASFYHSPQPARCNIVMGHTQRSIPASRYQHNQNYDPCNSFNSSQRFRQNTNTNHNNNSNHTKIPARLRMKVSHNNNNNNNANYNNTSNNNSNYNNNNTNYNTYKYNRIDNRSPFPLSQTSSPFQDVQSTNGTLQSIQHHSPLQGFQSLQINGKTQHRPGFEDVCSSMPQSMKLITPKYRHQISEPQLFRNFAIDSSPLEAVTTPCFVTDQSKRWYHPTMSREQAINLLLDKPAGSFIIRSSNTFEGSYGLVMKVDKVPQQINTASPHEFVRHFLIETSSTGVRIKGSPIEPTFGSLSTLVYQHMLTPLSLPCSLLLSKFDHDVTIKHENPHDGDISQIIEETFYYINSDNTEGLTGQVAMEKVVNKTFNSAFTSKFKVTKVKLRLDDEGLTLTDLERRLFFRKKFLWKCISYSGVENSTNVYSARDDDDNKIFLGRLFCIVARSSSLARENTCHVLSSVKFQDHNFINSVEAINDKIRGNK